MVQLLNTTGGIFDVFESVITMDKRLLAVIILVIAVILFITRRKKDKKK